MPDSIIVSVAVLGLALAATAAVLAAIGVARLGALGAARESAAREAAELRTRLEVLAAQSADFERDLKLDLSNARTEQAAAGQTARAELAATLGRHTQAMQQQLTGMAGTQNEQLKLFGERLAQLTQTNEQRLEAVRATLEQRLDLLRSENAKKLDEMRATVDEKLQATLEQRLGQSFKQVSDRLEQVHKGLGEMQSLAAGVGDLKKVLTNVKSRGGWGEVQLGTLLCEMLTPAQYAQNVATRPGSKERVEFAIKFPGRSEDGAPCWLPIDAKFPLEDYQRIVEASERGDAAAVEAAARQLEARLEGCARDIHQKYVNPPYTTDFGLLYLPTEGLYAEVTRRPGLLETLQREHRVSVAGPTTLAALLNCLQMGFRTLAIQQRSSEVWQVLGAVKAELGKFGDVLAKVEKKLSEASSTLEVVASRRRVLERKLKTVQEIPAAQADALLLQAAGVEVSQDD
jgi:DNA recombination protein RmuC